VHKRVTDSLIIFGVDALNLNLKTGFFSKRRGPEAKWSSAPTTWMLQQVPGGKGNAVADLRGLSTGLPLLTV